MALDVPVAAAVGRPRILARVAALPVRYVLGAIVGASFLIRWALAGAHVTPFLFPDEYLYPTVARSLAVGDGVAIRGEAVGFPALLEPLLIAPLWALDDPHVSLRLTQVFHAFAMSLAAIPVYLLAQRLGLGRAFALGAAVLAVAVPDMVYASFLLADPIGYPLALGAVCAGVVALAGGGRRAQLLFIALALLAAFARIQFAPLLLVFVVAALVVERGRVRRVLTTYWPTLAVVGAAAAVMLGAGPARAIGVYAGAIRFHPSAGEVADWLGADLMLLAYAAGWVMVPGALIGLAGGLVRPRTRAEHAFAAFASILTVVLVAEAAYIAAFDSSRFQERYLFALLPLTTLAFGLGVSRSRGWRLATVGAALALLLLATWAPTVAYSVGGGQVDSPFLWAVFTVHLHLSAAATSFVVSITAVALSLVAAALALRPRLAPAGLALTLAAFVAVSVGTSSHAASTADVIRRLELPADARWIDHNGVEDVALVQTPGASDDSALHQLFWNREVENVFLLADAVRVDPYASQNLRIADDGRLVADGETVRQSLLVQRFATALSFTGAQRVAQTRLWDLWRATGTPRVSTLAAGLYYDGWLGSRGVIVVVPDASGRASGTLRLTLSMPKFGATTSLRLHARGFTRRVTLAPGRRTTLAIPVSHCGPWVLRFNSADAGYLGDRRRVSVKSTLPAFSRDRSPRPCADANAGTAS